LAVVVGGTSAEFTLKTVKLASTHYLDDLPTTGMFSASQSVAAKNGHCVNWPA